jgi:hypothetical protein
MGSIILQAADQRVMTRHSRIMIHYGNFGMHQHTKIVYKWANETKKFDQIMEDIYLDKIGDRKITLEKYLTLIGKELEIPQGNAKNKKVLIGRKELQEMLNFDTIIDAETALELNLIDKIEDKNA